jgi:competence protein ComEC
VLACSSLLLREGNIKMFNNFSKSKIFLLVCLSFIIGITNASFLSEKIFKNEIIYFAFFVFTLAFSIIFYNNKNFFIGCLICSAFFIGLWRYSQFIQINSPDKVYFYNGQKVSIRGIIRDEPDVSDKWQKITIATVEVNQENFIDKKLGEKPKIIREKTSGNVLVTTDLYPGYKYGDEIIVECNLEKPKSINNFAYDQYLARFDIYSVCYYPQIKRINSDKGSFFYKNILIVKQKLRSIINLGLSEPESSLARATMLGDRRGMPEDLRQAFAQTGLSHIIAISGLHITLLATITMSMLLAVGLWRRWAFYATTLILIFYIVMSGSSASAVRSGVMGFLVLFAVSTGRISQITNTVLLAGAILLFFNPLLLKPDIGFQLSFLSVLGIIYVYPIIDILLEKYKIFRLKAIREALAITLASQILCWPVLVCSFNMVSISAPLANLLVLWSSSLQMIAIFLGVILSLIIPSLAIVFFLPAKLLLSFMVSVAVLISKIPWSYLNIDYFWPGWAFIYYFVLIIYLYNNKSIKNKKK